MDWNANFPEMCRCCTRTESGMTSIFDGIAHSTNPPLDEMLNNIACLNVQKGDGLPSLVCTLCINNIQGAYTFLLQLTEIDAQLWHIFHERRTQGTCGFGTIQAEETLLKNFHEDVNHSLKVEDLNVSITEDMSMQNFYDNTAENPVPEIEEANKLQSRQEQCEDVSKLACDMSNKTFKIPGNTKCVKSEPSLTAIITKEDSSGSNTLTSGHDHANANDPIKEEVDAIENVDIKEEQSEEMSPKLRATHRTTTIGRERRESSHMNNHNINTVNDNDDLLKVQTIIDMEDFDDVDDMGADEDYQEDSSTDSSDDEYDPYEKPKQSGKSSGRGVGKPPNTKTKSAIVKGQRIADRHQNNVDEDEQQKAMNPTDALVFKCKLCAYTNMRKNKIKKHLQTHLENKAFACSKCNYKFTRKDAMKRHWANCNGDNILVPRVRELSKQLIPLTLEDLKDPETLKKYYSTTVIANNRENNNSDVRLEQKISNAMGMKCKLCPYTSFSVHKCALKQHLLTHLKDKAFACSKCNRTYTQKGSMLRHWQSCNGNSFKLVCNDRKPKKLISLTLEDLKDQMNIKKFFSTASANDDVDIKIEGNLSDVLSNPTDALVFKCRQCVFTCVQMFLLKQHLQTHLKHEEFPCPKCNYKFTRKDVMLHHFRKCSGEITKWARALNKRKVSQSKIPLTLQDLEDPEKIKKYYTVGK